MDINNYVFVTKNKMAAKNKFVDDWNFAYDGRIWFFRWMHCLGMYSCYRNQNGTMKWKSRNRRSFTCVAILVVLSVIEGTMGYINIYYLMTITFNLEEALLYGGSLMVPLFLGIAILTLAENPKIADFLNECKAFQEMFERETNRSLYRKPSHKWIIVMVLNLITGISMMGLKMPYYHQIYEKNNLNKLYQYSTFLFFVVTCLQTCTLFYLWYFFNSSIKFAANTLIQKIECLDWKYEKPLDVYIILWLNISQLCNDLGKAMYRPILYFSASLFGVLMVLLYVSYIAFLRGSCIEFVFSTMFLLSFPAIAEISQNTMEAVGENFKKRLMKLLLNGKVRGYENDFVKFIEMVNSCPTYISLGGFINMDRGINVPLFSSILTYFIIVVQFGSESDKK